MKKVASKSKPKGRASITRSRAIRSTIPYALPRTIGPSLAKICAYWEGLKRGQNEIPFADDLKMSRLIALSDQHFLIESLALPARFRFGIVSTSIQQTYGKDLSGTFIDEIEAGTPSEYLNSQCSATTTSGTPTYFRNAAPNAYGRILLPMWADGRVSMLLGVIVEAKKPANIGEATSRRKTRR